MRERRRHLLAAGLLWDTSFNLTRITMRFSQGKEKNSSCEESYPVDLAVGVLMYFIYHWIFCPSLLFFSSHPLSASISVYLFTKWISSRLRNKTIRIWITLLSNVRKRKRQTCQDCFASASEFEMERHGERQRQNRPLILLYHPLHVQFCSSALDQDDTASHSQAHRCWYICERVIWWGSILR